MDRRIFLQTSAMFTAMPTFLAGMTCAKTQPQWIPFTDRSPQIGQKVIVSRCLTESKEIPFKLLAVIMLQ